MTEPFVFNPLDPATRRDPFALYARGRSEFPVFRHEGLPMRIFSAFRFATCQAVLRDDERWSNEFDRIDGEMEPALAELGPPPPPTMLGTDGEAHRRLRGLVNKAFTPRIIARREARMVELAEEMVDAALLAGEVDIVQALTYPLPVRIIAEIIGVPEQDQERFKQWSDQLVASLGTGFFGGVDIERIKRSRKILSEMRDYFVPLAERRRSDPQEDLLTGLVLAEHEGSHLSHDEMISMLTLILVAGNETTTTLIGNCLLELLAHPEQLALLRAEPSLTASAVEEVLRFASPVQFDPRRATCAMELEGQAIEENDIVLCWLGSANRDESVFDEPERFDIRRGQRGHLAFGFGAHYCLGANLARLEAEVALTSLLSRTSSIERSGSEELPLHASPVFRSVTRLPLRLKGV